MSRLFIMFVVLILPLEEALSSPSISSSAQAPSGHHLGLPTLTQADPSIIELGQTLFFDPQLSINGSTSCATCHVPKQGFTQNQLATPLGINGTKLKRNSPSLLNVGYWQSFFHDGRETSLETQVFSPLLSDQEMANPSIGWLLQRIANVADYNARFNEHLGGLTMNTLGLAMAAYQRSLIAADSPFDRWFFLGQGDNMPLDAIAGFAIFNRHGCGNCHLIDQSYATFEDGLFHNTGVGYASAFVTPAKERDLNDMGRFEVTHRLEDRWRYRTPTLRNITLTSPYMHDGSMADLKSVIAYYMQGGFSDPHQDPRLLPFTLSDIEIKQLITFLQSLTSPHVESLIRSASEVTPRDAQ